MQLYCGGIGGLRVWGLKDSETVLLEAQVQAVLDPCRKNLRRGMIVMGVWGLGIPRADPPPTL